MLEHFFSYFSDPLLRAPLIGSMLMCVSASLVGVTVFLRKQSLIGETLSHAAYPGVVLGVSLIGVVLGDITTSPFMSVTMLTFAFTTSLLGMGCMSFLQKKIKVYPDAALCFVLSFFFGVGILLSSFIQFPFSNLYRQVQTYFYGQVVTLNDLHVALYGGLALLIGILLIIFRKEFKTWIFDPDFARTSALPVETLEWIYLILVTLSIAIGIRTVGVVLMSAMLIAPAVAARQLSNRLKNVFFLAVLFGVLSAAIGTYIANELSLKWTHQAKVKMSVPLGPTIVLVASLICLLAILFSPERGVITKAVRTIHFRMTCLRENILKTLWRLGPSSMQALKNYLSVDSVLLHITLNYLTREGWIEKRGSQYHLTGSGDIKAKQIIRLHRLWELYLSDYIGIGVERVHASAEEMEHILTPELEKELTELLHHPIQDPHHQPIPPSKEELRS